MNEKIKNTIKNPRKAAAALMVTAAFGGGSAEILHGEASPQNAQTHEYTKDAHEGVGRGTPGPAGGYGAKGTPEIAPLNMTLNEQIQSIPEPGEIVQNPVTGEISRAK